MDLEFPIERIHLADTPFILAFGGSEEAKDRKLIFIDSVTKIRYTMSLILDNENGKVIIDFHQTDENVSIDMSKPRREQERYKPIIRIIIDTKGMNQDEQRIGEALKQAASQNEILVESDAVFAGKIIIPILKSFDAPHFFKKGKEVITDGKQLAMVVEQIKGVADLDRLGFNMATVKDERIGGAVYKKEDKWYYFDMIAFAKKGLLIFEPYITTEVISKEEFFGKLK